MSLILYLLITFSIPNYTFPLLRTGFGTRAAGMGNSFLALSDDVSGLWWNPAGLSQLPRGEVLSGYRHWLSGMHNDFTALAYPLSRSTLGVGFLVAASEVEAFSKENEYEGKYIAGSGILLFSYSYQLMKKFFLGTTVKGLYDYLGSFWGGGWGLDFGVFLYPVSFLKIGGVLRNLGRIYYKEWWNIPRELGIGVSLESFKKILFSSDMIFCEDRSPYFNFGVEYIRGIFSLRGGYRTGPHSWKKLSLWSGLSSGLGIEVRGWKINYALLSFGELGLTHWISVSRDFGKRTLTGELLIRTVDSQTREPIDALLSFDGIKSFKGRTSKEGSYHREWLPVGWLSVKAERKGYYPFSDSLFIKGGEKNEKILPLMKIPLGSIKGMVYAAKTRNPLMATLHYQGVEEGEVMTDKRFGAYKTHHLKAGEYLLLVKPENNLYIPQSQRVIVEEGKECIQNFALHKKESPKILVTVHLNFETGKAELLPQSYPILDEIGKALEGHPNLMIEIAGHTDSVPIHTREFPSNLELSYARAKAVKNYLIKKFHIAPKRLKVKGYADTQPLAPNSSPEGRAMNRRIEFRIIKER